MVWLRYHTIKHIVLRTYWNASVIKDSSSIKPENIYYYSKVLPVLLWQVCQLVTVLRRKKSFFELHLQQFGIRWHFQRPSWLAVLKLISSNRKRQIYECETFLCRQNNDNIFVFATFPIITRFNYCILIKLNKKM